VATALLLMNLLAVTQGQDATAPLRFAAAVINPTTQSPQGRRSLAPDQFSQSSTTLHLLLAYAYDLPLYRVVGGPSWITSDRFDVLAKASMVPTPAQMRTLVQNLLTERFALRLHHETRELPVYDLVFVRADHRLGPQMAPAQIDCTPFATGTRPMSESPLIDNGTGNMVPRCASGASVDTARREVRPRLNGMTMPRLIQYLERSASRVVADKTGLTGAFDIQLAYQDDSIPAFPGVTRVESDVPLLRDALIEQLGLKLEPSKGPVEVLVIDSAEMPTDN
jgi:uncharacterized protein (TIGR03435 family)